MGTLAGLLGAGFIGLLSIWVEDYTFVSFIFIAFFGFIGMILDSVIGDLFQAKYQNGDGTLSDQGNKLAKGINGFSNDTTNWVSNVVTVIICVIVLYFLKPL